MSSKRFLLCVGLIISFTVSNGYAMGKKPVDTTMRPPAAMSGETLGGDGAGDGKGTIGGLERLLKQKPDKGTIGGENTDSFTIDLNKGTIGTFNNGRQVAACVDRDGVTRYFYRNDPIEKNLFIQCLHDLVQSLGGDDNRF